MTKLELNQIYDKVKIYMQQEFNFYYDLPLNYNNRLYNAIAQVRFPNPRVEVSPMVLKASYLNQEALLDIFKHEAIHYYLWFLHLDFQDGDSNFEHILQQKKLPSTSFNQSPVTNTLLLIYHDQHIYINRYL